MANTDVKTMLLRVDVDSSGAIVNMKDLNAQLKDMGVNTKQAIKDLDNLEGKIKDNGSAAGVAGAATTEFGRLLSDLPYGIQGVANNLSQLGSMFALLVQKTGSAKEALNSMLDVVYKGGKITATGVLIGFQAVVAIIEMVSKHMSKAAKETDESLERMREAATTAALDFEKLKILADIAQDSTQELEIQQGALEDLKEMGFDPATQSIKDFLKEQEKLLIARAASKALEEELGDIIKQEIVNRVAQKKALSELITMRQENQALTGSQEAVIDELKKQKDALEERKNELKRALKESMMDIILFGDGDPTKVGKNLTKKIRKIKPRLLLFSELVDPLKLDAETGEGLIEKIVVNQEKRMLTFEETLELSRELMMGFSDFLTSEADREIAIEQNKTNRINEQLRERLRNESLTAKQRGAINNQIAKNDAKLVQKENEIAKKRFKQQKAAAIANALINTYLAASKVMTNPTDLNPVAIAIKVAATIAMGLMQVAAIARQQFTPKTSGAGGRASGGQSGGGGGGRGTSVFNVVGASELNQVAEAVAGQREDPVRAYVVASEVSTVQELDRNIVSEASIG